jgi:hypothetical protein
MQAMSHTLPQSRSKEAAMRVLVVCLLTTFTFAAAAQAGQPIVKLAAYQDLGDDAREAFVVGIYDGLMVAEQYHKTQELAWLTDCTAHGTSSRELFDIFEAYLPDHTDAAAFGVAGAFVFAMADHCDNAPQFMKDLAR